MNSFPPPEELRRRIEAARAYADISSQEKLAKAIEISKDTLVRKLRGDYPFKRSELLAIADVCDLPIDFLIGEWPGFTSRAEEEDDGPDPVDLAAQLARDEDEESRGHG
jgi:DNA-binding XRE family transcriptional regulator